YLGWGFAWPNNVRVLYNRASADPEGRPWSDRKRYVWWDEGAGRWTGLDTPDFPPTTAPSYQPPEGATGLEGLSGTQPFVMLAEGLGRLFVPKGLKDGPLPTHYEPFESPILNPLYSQQTSPTALDHPRGDNVYHDVADAQYPHVLTTYRLTEHHTAGAMSRWVPWLAELQPELFVELSPELARERGIENAGWATVVTPRGAIECKALVTRRIRPFQVNGRTVHQVGMPWHWGYRGVVTGDVVNALSALVGDPNVTIHESKAFMCDVRAGRRRTELAALYRDAATPLPRAGRRERQAAEANIDFGIELAAKAESLDELVVREPRYTLDQPEGVYHG
ncbi:MAG TPA: molybdopterin dinucleotide binding domain-containing protein, partial [Gemmatimonadaceae bacterium]|nr:molybdopterin dinucleotide binding domain-containing protein [Gemmatimonadaceae bacterium]